MTDPVAGLLNFRPELADTNIIAREGPKRDAYMRDAIKEGMGAVYEAKTNHDLKKAFENNSDGEGGLDAAGFMKDLFMANPTAARTVGMQVATGMLNNAATATNIAATKSRMQLDAAQAQTNQADAEQKLQMGEMQMGDQRLSAIAREVVGISKLPEEAQDAAWDHVKPLLVQLGVIDQHTLDMIPTFKDALPLASHILTDPNFIRAQATAQNADTNAAKVPIAQQTADAKTAVVPSVIDRNTASAEANRAKVSGAQQQAEELSQWNEAVAQATGLRGDDKKLTKEGAAAVQKLIEAAPKGVMPARIKALQGEVNAVNPQAVPIRASDQINVNKEIRANENRENSNKAVLNQIENFSAAAIPEIKANPGLREVRLGELQARALANPNSPEGEMWYSLQRLRGMKIAVAAQNVSGAAGGRATQQEVLLSQDGVLNMNFAYTTVNQLLKNLGEMTDDSVNLISQARRSTARLPGVDSSKYRSISKDQINDLVAADNQGKGKDEAKTTPRQMKVRLLKQYPNIHFED